MQVILRKIIGEKDDMVVKVIVEKLDCLGVEGE